LALDLACAKIKYFIQKTNHWKGAKNGEQGTRKRKRQGQKEEEKERRQAKEVVFYSPKSKEDLGELFIIEKFPAGLCEK
jgi:hypothetical protein